MSVGVEVASDFRVFTLIACTVALRKCKCFTEVIRLFGLLNANKKLDSEWKLVGNNKNYSNLQSFLLHHP